MTTQTLQEHRAGVLKVLHFATNNAEPSRKLEVVEDVEIVEIARLLRVWNRLPLSFRVWMIDQLEIDEEKIRLGIPLKKPDGRWRKPKETPAETQGDLITISLLRGRSVAYLRGFRAGLEILLLMQQQGPSRTPLVVWSDLAG
jgi:hypothetical protein